MHNYMELDNTSEISKHETWKPEHNTILSEWADKSMCYRWLHFRSHLKFNYLNRIFTIPVIVISTLTGTANFAIDSYGIAYSGCIIGAFNILGGIIQTLHQFLKLAELNEAHKVASLSWDKFSRNIKTELTKNPEDRLSASYMIKHYKEEYDRLMETCPVINDSVIKEFHKTFGNSANFIKVTKPDICGELIPTTSIIYKNTYPIISNGGQSTILSNGTTTFDIPVLEHRLSI